MLLPKPQSRYRGATTIFNLWDTQEAVEAAEAARHSVAEGICYMHTEYTVCCSTYVRRLPDYVFACIREECTV